MAISEQLTEEQACLAMFNRAIAYNDGAAWQFLYERYNGMMRGWLRQFFAPEALYGLESEENCIAQGFEKFWYATTCTQHIRFDTVASALHYLRSTLRSVAIDIIRKQRRNEVVPLENITSNSVLATEDDKEAYELWEEIKKILPEKREQRIASLLFNCNLKPRQIVELLPEEFSNVQELYRVRRKVFERFTNNADILRWRLLGE